MIPDLEGEQKVQFEARYRQPKVQENKLAKNVRSASCAFASYLTRQMRKVMGNSSQLSNIPEGEKNRKGAKMSLHWSFQFYWQAPFLFRSKLR